VYGEENTDGTVRKSSALRPILQATSLAISPALLDLELAQANKLSSLNRFGVIAALMYCPSGWNGEEKMPINSLSNMKFGLGGASDWLATVATPSRLLRWSFGCVYLWFGLLKLLDVSPAVTLIGEAFPSFIDAPLFHALTFFEIAAGILFFSGLWVRWAMIAAALHLLGTLATLTLAPSVVFLDHFPLLSIEGEFVVKNIVLLAALYALWTLEANDSPSYPSWTDTPKRDTRMDG
jgi:putative oxidoreductase